MSGYDDVMYDGASEHSAGVESYDNELEIQYYNNKFRSIEDDESTIDSWPMNDLCHRCL
mgnify:CR=1 FL=1